MAQGVKPAAFVMLQAESIRIGRSGAVPPSLRTTVLLGGAPRREEVAARDLHRRAPRPFSFSTRAAGRTPSPSTRFSSGQVLRTRQGDVLSRRFDPSTWASAARAPGASAAAGAPPGANGAALGEMQLEPEGEGAPTYADIFVS